VLVCTTYDGLPPIPHTDGVADGVTSELRHAGFDVTTVLDPCTSGIRACVATAVEDAHADDVVLLYFLGYAREDGGVARLLAADATSTEGQWGDAVDRETLRAMLFSRSVSISIALARHSRSPTSTCARESLPRHRLRARLTGMSDVGARGCC
jgi:uncharacterized caspase-like protein